MRNVLPLETHVVLSLVLHKIVDPDPSVRTAARSLLASLHRSSPQRLNDSEIPSPDGMDEVRALCAWSSERSVPMQAGAGSRTRSRPLRNATPHRSLEVGSSWWAH